MEQKATIHLWQQLPHCKKQQFLGWRWLPAKVTLLCSEEKAEVASPSWPSLTWWLG